MRRALIVDDKPENQYFLAAMLAGNGYAVDRAGNGLEALTLAAAHVPDLVISDILMPGMDGFTLCRRWRQDSRLREVPFVFYTATYTDPKDEQLAMSLGANLFLVKPQEPEEFMQQIASVLRQHQAGHLQPSPAAAMEESDYLREYNAALVHKLEEKLLELEHASKVRNILLGSVSHELRSPLTPVMVLVDLLLGDPDTPAPMRQDLETIRRHMEIERHLIGDLLDYAAMQSGTLHLRRRPLSLHSLVQKVMAPWQEHCQVNGLAIERRLDAQCDQTLGDYDRLEQVVWNLIHNAVRRSPPHAPILVRSSNPEPGRIALQVHDSGKPMDAEAVAWAFSPFERGTRVGEGSGQDAGLGLMVSKGLIEAHGGQVSIHSTAQALGTAVTVLLPVRQDHPGTIPNGTT